jgi:hypothetical protein
MAPHIAKQGDQQGNHADGRSLLYQEGPGSRSLNDQDIDGLFDDQGNHKQEEIHYEQTQNTCCQRPSILYKIYPEGPEIVECGFKGSRQVFQGWHYHFFIVKNVFCYYVYILSR